MTTHINSPISLVQEAPANMLYSDKELGIAVIGMGTVGRSVVQILLDHAGDLAARIGVKLVLRGIGVRDLSKKRDIPADSVSLTDNVLELIEREDVDIVIEVVGGIHPAKVWLSRALSLGKSVITANKVLIADHLAELAQLAAEHHADLYYEAAVAGAIPVVRPIQQSLAGDIIHRVTGIVNGTTNFILSRMEATGQSYEAALDEAIDLGYAEKADPSADVEGYDAAAKTAIIASIAFHNLIEAKEVYREGITQITPEDMAFAARMNRVIKLLSICELIETEVGLAISARVYPALVPLNHPIGQVHGVNNAVVVDAKYSGQLMFYGQGAGGDPTASAILGDVVMAARNKTLFGRGPLVSDYANLPVINIDEIASRFYIALLVPDRPGVLSAISAIFAHRNISIATVWQQSYEGTYPRNANFSQTDKVIQDAHVVPSDPIARLVLTSHEIEDVIIRQVLEDIKESEFVYQISSVLRLEF